MGNQSFHKVLPKLLPFGISPGEIEFFLKNLVAVSIIKTLLWTHIRTTHPFAVFEII